VELFESHMSNGKAMGGGLPKFGEVGWPPPFRQTVKIMRKFLNNNCGSSSRWTTGAVQCQKAYFNRTFGLQKTGVHINVNSPLIVFNISNTPETIFFVKFGS